MACCAFITLAAALDAPAAAAADALAQAFLIQNSGWMEPFYVDPKSEFKPLVTAVVQAAAAPADDVLVAAFSQSVPGLVSPAPLFRGAPEAKRIEAAIRAIDLAKKPGSPAYADTDFHEALTQTITRELKGKSAVVWIFTNNKNSPSNSQETARRNQEFYDLLHGEPTIKRIIAYPLRMAVEGRHYRANGLMVYAIAYGQAADVRLQALMRSGALKKVFTNLPARLKPLDQEAVVFLPKLVKDTPGVTAGLGADGKTLVLGFDASRKPLRADIVGAFRNDFYPYAISRARVSAEHSSGGAKGVAVQVAPAALARLEPGQRSADVTLGIVIPPLPSVWDPEILFGGGYRLRGVMRVVLDDQALELSGSFPALMNQLFPGDPLPELFRPYRKASSSHSVLPVVVEVAYPTWPLLVLAALALLLVALLVAAALLLSRAKRYDVTIDGEGRRVLLKHFQTLELRSAQGEHVGTVRRLGAGVRVVWAKDGHTVSAA